jgi:hypothetical protein
MKRNTARSGRDRISGGENVCQGPRYRRLSEGRAMHSPRIPRHTESRRFSTFREMGKRPDGRRKPTSTPDGWGGIRVHGALAGLPVFKSGSRPGRQRPPSDLSRQEWPKIDVPRIPRVPNGCWEARAAHRLPARRCPKNRHGAKSPRCRRGGARTSDEAARSRCRWSAWPSAVYLDGPT